jgi:hypothetical protein
MHHRLLVLCLEERKFPTAALLEGLAQTTSISVAQDAEHSAENSLLDPISLAALRLEETDNRLGRR